MIYKVDINLPNSSPEEAFEFCLDMISDLMNKCSDKQVSKMKATLKHYLPGLTK